MTRVYNEVLKFALIIAAVVAVHYTIGLAAEETGDVIYRLIVGWFIAYRLYEKI